jgi:hypothetical protein
MTAAYNGETRKKLCLWPFSTLHLGPVAERDYFSRYNYDMIFFKVSIVDEQWVFL